MRYALLIIDNDVRTNKIEEREHFFVTVTQEDTAVEAGATWIKKYPHDIAMVVEVEEGTACENDG